MKKRAINRALSLAMAHPQVGDAHMDDSTDSNAPVSVHITFDVNLPSEWKRRGQSPSGVQLKEVVRFDFPGDYPMQAPQPSLRADFNRNLPHMQPWLMDGRPVPCIYDGELTELFHREGFGGILNQTAVWLDRAADGTLIDPDQGWEPVRRDSCCDLLIADADRLRGLVNHRGGYRFLRMNYITRTAGGQTHFVYGQIADEQVRINRNSASTLFKESLLGSDRASQLRRGISLGLVVWPGKTLLG